MSESNQLFKELVEALRIGVIRENAFRTRMLGILSELEFASYYGSISQSKILNGGFLIPIKEKVPATEQFVYFTTVEKEDSITDYLEVYRAISRLKPVILYLMHIDYKNPFIEWETIDLENREWKIPPLTMYQYDIENHEFIEKREGLSELLHFYEVNPYFKSTPITLNNKNQIDQFRNRFLSLDIISQKDSYFIRFLMDVFIGMRHYRGIPSDIDVISILPNSEMSFLEIKEKDIAKKIEGFGLDLHRIKDMLYISKNTYKNYYLVVKRVNNQIERKFIGWYYISIQDFEKFKDPYPIEGGKGMRSTNSYNPTFICELKHFKTI